jgi:hypothetical protein
MSQTEADAARGAYSVPVLVLSAVLAGGILELVGLAFSQEMGTPGIDLPSRWWTIASVVGGLLYGHAAAKPLSAADLELNRRIKEQEESASRRRGEAESRRPQMVCSCPYCIKEVHRDATICPYCRSRLA